MGKIAGNAVVVMIALVVGLLLTEGAAQFYAYKIVKQGKMFRPDHRLGWAVLPNLDLTRYNHDGGSWRIITDDSGLRGPSHWSDNGERRMLIIGDSFAFGEGIDLENRFDTLIAEQVPGLSIVNIGVMGYGTDQSMINMRSYSKHLRPGDILLVLTYSNDFFDIASTRQSGRSKPWFEWKNGELKEHKPEIGLMEIIRDRSFLLSRVATTFNTDDPEAFEDRLLHAGDLFEQIVIQEVAALLKRGISVVVAHHGDTTFDLPFRVSAVFESVCKQLTGCIALDPMMSERSAEEVFLSDGHWSVGGHKVAANLIAQHLVSILTDQSAQGEAPLQENRESVEMEASPVPAVQ